MRLLSLDMIDGRTRVGARVRNTETQLAADLGGDLTEAQKALARRAAIINAVIEDQETRWARGEKFDLAEHLAATNTLRRVLSTLGIERRAKAVNGRSGLQPLLGGR